MRCFRFILYVLAAVAYAVMPINGMATETMDPLHSAMMSMSPQAMMSTAPVSHDPAAGCAGHTESNKHTGMGCGHCAACLTLPAQQMVFEAQSMVRAVPMPGLGVPLFSQNNSPLVPPPRH